MNEAFLWALVNAISHKNIYLDQKTRDPKADTISAKHSLAAKRIPESDIYTFFPLFGNSSALKKGYYIEVKANEHLEDKIEGYFKEEIGYIDVTKAYSLTGDELFLIISDETRGFRKSARLCDDKWDEFLQILKESKYKLTKIEPDQQVNTVLCLYEEEVANELFAAIGKL